MKRISREYVDFLESVIFSLLTEREKAGKFDDFEKVDLDLGPNDKLETYSPDKIKETMLKTYKEFVNNGWK